MNSLKNCLDNCVHVLDFLERSDCEASCFNDKKSANLQLLTVTALVMASLVALPVLSHFHFQPEIDRLNRCLYMNTPLQERQIIQQLIDKNTLYRNLCYIGAVVPAVVFNAAFYFGWL